MSIRAGGVRLQVTMTLKLLSLPSAFGVRTASPFALKAEVLLALSGLKHDIEMSEPRFGPRGKMPVLHDGELVVPDTRNIQHHLETVRGIDFDGHLNEEARAQVVLARRTVEEHLYWAQTFFRWFDHADIVRETLFASVPWPMRSIVFAMVRRNLNRDLWGHGYGRLPRDEKLQRAREDIRALRALLGERNFYFGDRPGSLDATVYPIMLNLLAPEAPSPLAEDAEAFRDYVLRVEEAVFGVVSSNLEPKRALARVA